ncbi:unnamed protein product [Allacma fusca]|uniref:Uncharacterized protein n=1 Tax=Allacma fusca TaxID=39272 RepID=A0A8J2LKW7_9HEXA|nr:unnamed protein product [Allacma fusca]
MNKIMGKPYITTDPHRPVPARGMTHTRSPRLMEKNPKCGRGKDDKKSAADAPAIKQTPDAKDALKIVGDKRVVKGKKHIVKIILSDPGLSPSVDKDGSGVSSTQDSKNKHYVWDESKFSGSHKSTSLSLASGNKKPTQKIKSMGGMESKPGPKSSEKGSTKGNSTGNDGKKFVWDIKSQTPKPQNADCEKGFN